MDKIHSLILVDVDPEGHRRLVEAVNSRKYHFEGFRTGYCRPHMSEMKLYNVRCKKEVMPYVLRDFGAETLTPSDKISLWDVIKGPKRSPKNAFFDGRVKFVAAYIIQKLGKLIRINPPVIAKDRPQQKFIDGWCYVHTLGNIDDIVRQFGEEL